MEQRKVDSTLAGEHTSKYPMFSINAAVLLMLLAPFTTSWLAVVSFVICLYRVVRYDVRVFAMDYSILIPISALMKAPNGTPLAIYLCLIAAIWYFARSGVKVSKGIVVGLLLLLNYLLARMQMNINDFVLLFGQIFSTVVLISKQDSKSAQRAVKAYCTSLLVVSVCAYLLRNTSALASYTGMRGTAMFGTNTKRFCGLAGDPNYYMTYIIVGIALVLKLRDSRAIGTAAFWVQLVGLSVLGLLTYSKAFLLLYVFTIGIYIVWQYWNRKLMKGMVFTIFAVAVIFLLMTVPNSPFAVIINRLTSAQNLNDLTTGRVEVMLAYLDVITESLPSFLFGQGMAAQSLYLDPHMIYLEVLYYLGVVGLVLLFALFVGVFHMANRRCAGGVKQNLIAKYIVLVLVLIAYLSLHGAFSQMFHAQMLLAALGLMVKGSPASGVKGMGNGNR